MSERCVDCDRICEARGLCPRCSFRRRRPTREETMAPFFFVCSTGPWKGGLRHVGVYHFHLSDRLLDPEEARGVASLFGTIEEDDDGR